MASHSSEKEQKNSDINDLRPITAHSHRQMVVHISQDAKRKEKLRKGPSLPGQCALSSVIKRNCTMIQLIMAGVGTMLTKGFLTDFGRIPHCEFGLIKEVYSSTNPNMESELSLCFLSTFQSATSLSDQV